MLESGGGWLPWQQAHRSPQGSDEACCHYKIHTRYPLWYQTEKLVYFDGRGGDRGQTQAKGPTFAYMELGLVKWVLLYFVCRKMERKLPDGNKDSKTTRRKENCYSLTQEGCQVHLWIKQLCTGKVCHKLMWRGQRNLTSFLRIYEMTA